MLFPVVHLESVADDIEQAQIEKIIDQQLEVRRAPDDLVARAWIPRCTSATATDISARFEVDTGELWGTFKFNRDAFDCPTEVVEPSRGPRSAGLEWWPELFPAASATILSIPEDRLFYAVVDSSGGRVFFWKLGAHTKPL